MKVIKNVNGQVVQLEFIKIMKYPRYGVYQVYKLINGKRIPLYKECLTRQEIQEIINNENIIKEGEYE